ncbi:MAG: leucine-rich repeat protein [Clostridiales bacterium]|nr:leucine-rich repeat protein [Clostridiales bacterium]
MKLLKRLTAAIAAIAVSCGIFIGCGNDNAAENQREKGDNGTVGLLYGEIGGDAYEVVGYIGDEKNVVVPAKHNGLPVTTIATDAFYYSETKVERVTLPEGLKSIEAHALWTREQRYIFFNIPSTVTKVGTFGTPERLPKDNVIDGCFYVDNCLLFVTPDAYDSEIRIKQGTRLIADGVLIGNQPVAIPDSVEYVGNAQSTMIGCTLSSIGKGLKRIGAGYRSEKFSFSRPDILDNVLLGVPQGYQDKVTVGKNIRVVSDGFMSVANANSCVVESGNANYYSENDYVIEKSTKRIVGGKAFSPIPKSAKIIGVGYLPREDEYTVIPDNIEVVEVGVYKNSSSKLRFGGNVKSLDAHLLPFGVEEIDYTGTVEQFCKTQLTGLFTSSRETNMFTSTQKLKIGGKVVTELKVPSGIEVAGAICGNGAVTGLTLPDTVKAIRMYGIGKNLQTLTCSGSLEYIGRQRLGDREETQTINLMYSGSIENLCAQKIMQCSTMYGDKYISYNLFMSNQRVTDLTIPNSVTKINTGAFFGIKLNSVTIPDSVTTIGATAFSLSGLTSAQFATPSGWKSIDENGEKVDVLVDLSDSAAAAEYLARYDYEMDPSGMGINMHECPALTRN